jgi:hypothetical protein
LLHAILDRELALLAGRQQSARWAKIVDLADSASRHGQVDCAKSAARCRDAIPVGSHGRTVAGRVGPNLGRSLDAFVDGWPHTREGLLLRHSDHRGAGILRNLRALNCTTGDGHRHSYRYR